MTDVKIPPNNPDAFPTAYGRGATLRDYFAAAALQGILANPTTVAGGATWDVVGAEVAKVAYIVADAMLAAREGK
jgi:hypothetical protein